MLYNKTMIWIDEKNTADTYAEFTATFTNDSKKKVWLQVACDGHFAAYLNGKLAVFGEAADYPWYKLYQKDDITKFCDGENELKIVVWYPGADTQTYIKDDAGVYFSVVQDGQVICESNCDTLSRQNVNYRNGYCKLITTQMGFSFAYDATVTNKLPYTPSVERKTIERLHLRKTGKVHLGERAMMQCENRQDGYLIDLGEETVGFLDLEFSSPVPQEIVISYGEHLVDGEVPRFIGERDFSVEYRVKAGENHHLNPFRRLAGRYLQVQCEKPLGITYLGLRKTDRKVVKIKRTFADSELQNIYDVSVNTLKKCMHEHYEDCPWREQAMYALDSRNQMLCGYYAFKGYQYQRENLLFMTKGQRADGLLSLCFPAGIDIPIPFFSLAYLMMIEDYITHTGDESVLKVLKPVADRILEAFQCRKDETGLIPNLPYPYWNFYEWSSGSHNNHDVLRGPEEPYVKQYDLILNSMYVLASRIYERVFGESQNEESMVTLIQNTFYNKEKDLYRLSTNGEAYSQLGNCFAILLGLGDKKLVKRVVEDDELIPVTLSMNTFYYDALLSIGRTYQDFVVADIRQKYGRMLKEGATTFWETEEGWHAFEDAGSLCHGWSAIPVYYLAKHQ